MSSVLVEVDDQAYGWFDSDSAFAIPLYEHVKLNGRSGALAAFGLAPSMLQVIIPGSLPAGVVSLADDAGGSALIEVNAPGTYTFDYEVLLPVDWLHTAAPGSVLTGTITLTRFANAAEVLIEAAPRTVTAVGESGISVEPQAAYTINGVPARNTDLALSISVAVPVLPPEVSNVLFGGTYVVFAEHGGTITLDYEITSGVAGHLVTEGSDSLSSATVTMEGVLVTLANNTFQAETRETAVIANVFANDLLPVGWDYSLELVEPVQPMHTGWPLAMAPAEGLEIDAYAAAPSATIALEAEAEAGVLYTQLYMLRMGSGGESSVLLNPASATQASVVLSFEGAGPGEPTGACMGVPVFSHSIPSCA